MIHLGDITKINGAEIEPVDCITFGSPCQDLSIAGKRQGLAGERSGLFMEAIRIIKEMRERGRADGRTNEFGDVFPRFAIWENVAGAFSSNRGEDFRCVLEEFCNIKGKDIIIPKPKNGKWDKAGIIIGDGFSVAWRLFDAQYWGVPQRRKRIAVVGDFAGGSAGEILFEREGVRGDIAESEQEGQGTSRSVGESSNGTDRAFTLKIRGGADTYIKSDGSVGTAGKGPLIQDNLSGTLGVSQDQTLFCSNAWNKDDNQSKRIMREESVSDPICSAEKRWAGIAPQVMQKVISDEIKDFVRDNNKNIDHQQDMLYTEEDKCGSLAAGTHGSAGHLHNIIIPMQDDGTTSMTKHGPGWHEENVGYTVNTVDRQSVAYGIDMQGGKGNANYKENKSPTLCSDSHGTPHGVAYGIGRDAFNMGENAQFGMSIEENTQPSITAKGARGVCNKI